MLVERSHLHQRPRRVGAHWIMGDKERMGLERLRRALPYRPPGRPSRSHGRRGAIAGNPLITDEADHRGCGGRQLISRGFSRRSIATQAAKAAEVAMVSAMMMPIASARPQTPPTMSPSPPRMVAQKAVEAVSLAAVTNRSSRTTLRQRFSPHPLSFPRTTWQRFSRAKTDSGWPLLMANFSGFILLATCSIYEATSGSFFYTVLSVSFVLGVLRTGHVILCVAHGKTGLTAAGKPITEPSDIHG